MSKVPRWKSLGINGKRDGTFGTFGTFDTFDQSGTPPVFLAGNSHRSCRTACLVRPWKVAGALIIHSRYIQEPTGENLLWKLRVLNNGSSWNQAQMERSEKGVERRPNSPK